MKEKNNHILTINAGSSSIKFALYEMHDNPLLKLSGKINRIGLKDAEFVIEENKNQRKENIDARDFHRATISLIDWLEKQDWFQNVNAIGHRVVHGMQHTQAEIITGELIKELNKISSYDPDHLPAEIEIINSLKKKHPQLLQVACFDTAFHTTIPAVAKTFAIPKKYFDEGIQRYGFHGISYSYLMEELKKKNADTYNGKIILAHLGNGASIAAVKDGKCIDTSMGFTPAGGIVMSTRSGDLDPGIAWYLMEKGMNAKDFNNLINHQSGLLGISGISADMQDLLRQQKENKDALLAIEIFCYQIKKYIGGYAAALGGLNVLVFSGGIGENASEVRSRICKGLMYLGVELNDEKNNKNEWQISAGKSKVEVYVIPTNEELMIAKETGKVFRKNKKVS
ncbi:MAG: acetate/propionate family kinase [Bacteroidota bacterium]|nr:acetate/propionate family kinase [Bacteroidota bacterium]